MPTSIGPMVHIVDDDPAVRDSLSFLLDSADLGVRAYASADALLNYADSLEPGCIVTDIRMPGMNGLELVGRLRQLGLRHPVIVLTGHADVSLAVAAMKAGVLEFLEKPFDGEVLLSAVRYALEQSESVALQTSERTRIEERIATLTQREREVLEAIIQGDSNKSAALRLGISPRTVEIYRANVMDKMQAKSLSELVRMALRVDII